MGAFNKIIFLSHTGLVNYGEQGSIVYLEECSAAPYDDGV